MKENFFRRAAVIVATALVVSCSVATAPAIIEDGRNFPWEKVELISEGMPAAQVREILGEPFLLGERDGEVWKYYLRVRQDDLVRVLGVLPYRKTFSHWERSVEISFRKGRVRAVSKVSRALPKHK